MRTLLKQALNLSKQVQNLSKHIHGRGHSFYLTVTWR